VKQYLFFIILLIVGNVHGFSFDFHFSSLDYSPGETVQLELSVNGVLEGELKNDDLNLMCSGENIGFVPNLLKVNNSFYYLFFNLGNFELGECLLSFDDVIYYENGFLKQANFETNFNIVDKNSSTIYVDPAGIIFNDFSSQSFILMNLFNSNEEDIFVSISSDLSFIEFGENVNIGSGEFVDINLYFSEFGYNGEKFGRILLEFTNNTFEIPIWMNIISGENDSLLIVDNITQVVGPKIEVLQGVEGFSLIISKLGDKSGYVLIQNNGIDLGLVEFKLSGNVSEIVDLQNDKLENFNSGDKFREYIYVNQGKDAKEGDYTGNLEIHYGEEIVKIPILIEITGVIINTTDGFNDTVISGNIDEEKGINIWIFVLIFFILSGIVLFLLYKKKTKKSVDFLKNV
jgi:hypothetical protein